MRSELIEILLSGEPLIFHAVIGFFRPHIQNQPNRKQIQIPDGNPQFHTPQKEQRRGHFPLTSANLFLTSHPSQGSHPTVPKSAAAPHKWRTYRTDPAVLYVRRNAVVRMVGHHIGHVLEDLQILDLQLLAIFCFSLIGFVAYWFRHDLSRIKNRFHVREIKTSRDIADWNVGKIPVAVIHPASAGHGLNLQAGGSTLVWFGLTWSLELYQQTNARLWRQGQESGTVVIQHIITKGTIDERIVKALSKKEMSQTALIDAVKADLEVV